MKRNRGFEILLSKVIFHNSVTLVYISVIVVGMKKIEDIN